MPVSKDQIATALVGFDGKHVAPLKALASSKLDAEAMQALISYLPGPQEIGASWVLKALAETGRLPPPQMRAFFQCLPDLSDPDAILHVLQCAQHSGAELARSLRPDLPPLYRHPRGLLRVWAFDAYCRGATLPDEQSDLAERVAQALQDRSKAMQARARNLARDFGLSLPPKP